jgi:hypothetical protein
MVAKQARNGDLTTGDLATLYPWLYHMAEAGSWDGIVRHGLLSTSALLDLFEVRGREREQIEEMHRADSVTIMHPVHGTAVIRDQKPMDDAGLRRALLDGISPREWYKVLNGNVFFWTSAERLNRLLSARAYRTRRQLVLKVRTAELLAKHADHVLLSPMNSGATKPFPHPRGKDTFLPIKDYPLEHWKRLRRNGEWVVELLVSAGVPDILRFVEEAKHVQGGLPEETLFRKAAE